MRCPFLREAQVKHCRASAYRKMILRSQDDADHERCTSAAYRECPALQHHLEESSTGTRCPFLQESLMQYCAAAAITKFIPYSESSLIRCGTDGHRYCDVYLTVAEPGHAGTQSMQVSAEGDISVDGIRMPAGVAFTSNHLWYDASADGSWHIGIDGFFARILHQVTAVNMLTPRGTAQPSAVLTAQGVDLPVVFPHPLTISATNPALRTAPQRVCSHPYTSGWLFEGSAPAGTAGLPSPAPNASVLYRGAAAVAWMRDELHHLNQFVHERILPARSAEVPVLMDGGVAAPGLIEHLDRQEILQLFNEFFSLTTPRR